MLEIWRLYKVVRPTFFVMALLDITGFETVNSLGKDPESRNVCTHLSEVDLYRSRKTEVLNLAYYKGPRTTYNR